MNSDGILPQLTVRETVAVLANVFVPNIAKGPIIRRRLNSC